MLKRAKGASGKQDAEDCKDQCSRGVRFVMHLVRSAESLNGVLASVQHLIYISGLQDQSLWPQLISLYAATEQFSARFLACSQKVAMWTGFP